MSAFQKTKLLWEKKAAEDGKQIDQAWKQQGEPGVIILKQTGKRAHLNPRITH